MNKCAQLNFDALVLVRVVATNKAGWEDCVVGTFWANESESNLVPLLAVESAAGGTQSSLVTVLKTALAGAY